MILSTEATHELVLIFSSGQEVNSQEKEAFECFCYKDL